MGTITVRGAPNEYECREGVLDRLEELCSKHFFQKGLILHGEKSWEAAQPYFPTLQHVDFDHISYQGECSAGEIERIKQKVGEDAYDVVLGVGGGKVLDLAKAVAAACQKQVILIPTLASTCAAWTPLSVLYNDDGSFVKYTIFPNSTCAVLIEPRIILDSPPQYLRAGIGDTLAKWYEARSLTSHLSSLPLSVQVALESAKMCKDVLLEHGQQAIKDQQEKRLSHSFLQTLEANIMLGGMVGGFGDKYGRISVAHSVHNGLVSLKETHHLLHGEKVAYGILVQLALEEEWGEIEELVPHYQALSLPLTLEEIGLSKDDSGVLPTVATQALKPGESIHLVPQTYKVNDVITSIYALQHYVQGQSFVRS